MSNVLTGLYRYGFDSVNVVSREPTGMIRAVSKDISGEMVSSDASQEQPIRCAIHPTVSASNIAPANIAPEGDSHDMEYIDVVLNKRRKTSRHLTAEEEKGLEAGDYNSDLLSQFIQESMRTIANEIESDLCALYTGASYAYGSAGTTPFATVDDLTQLSNVKKILDQNGAPMHNRCFVYNSETEVNLLGKQPSFFRTNEAGSTDQREAGMIRPIFGFMPYLSNQFTEHQKGDATQTINQSTAPAGYGIGARDLVIDGGGASENYNAGDILTFGSSDSTKYVVREDSGTNATTLNINKPGLRKAVADDQDITIGNNYTPNLAFSKDAFVLAVRMPAVNHQGDMGEYATVADEVSGLMFQLSYWKQYRQASIEVAAVWGVKAVNPAHAVILLG